MGNRAVITTSTSLEIKDSTDLGIYVHWNGGRDSVEAFLKYCEMKGYSSPEKDFYGWARLCQVIGNFLGGTNSLGIEKCCNLDCDNGDNGVYIIKDWKIVGRKYFDGVEQRNHDMEGMLLAIDESMHDSEQLGEGFIKADMVSRDDIRLGDLIYRLGVDGKVELSEVIGFGETGKIVNGSDVTGIPYVARYKLLKRYHRECAENINNYIFDEVVRRATA